MYIEMDKGRAKNVEIPHIYGPNMIYFINIFHPSTCLYRIRQKALEKNQPPAIYCSELEIFAEHYCRHTRLWLRG